MTLTEDSQRIILSKTKLFVAEGRLIRQSSTNQTISVIPLKSITDVTLRTETHWPDVIIPLIFLGGAAACKWFIPSPVFGWVLCIILATAALLGLMGMPRPKLTVHTQEGKVNFEITESFSDAEAFALSLKHFVKEHSS